MKFSLGIRYLYFFSLILFAFIFFKFKPKPKIKEIILRENNLELLNNKTKNFFNTLNSPDNRINVGKSFLINENKDWYHISQISFWRSEYFRLNFVEKQLKIKDIKIKKLNNNNFALGTFKNQNISYACMENSKIFHHNMEIEEIPQASDFDYWTKVFKKNIKFVVYAFKPSNYQCMLVITSDKEFFKNPEQIRNKIIFSKFYYD